MTDNKNLILYHGDCLEILDKLIEEGVKVDAVIADPPYAKFDVGFDVLIDSELLFSKLWKILKPLGRLILFGDDPFYSQMLYQLVLDKSIDEVYYWKFRFNHEIIWEKQTHSNFLNIKNQPKKIHEKILVCSADFGVGFERPKGKAYNYIQELKQKYFPTWTNVQLGKILNKSAAMTGHYFTPNLQWCLMPKEQYTMLIKHFKVENPKPWEELKSYAISQALTYNDYTRKNGKQIRPREEVMQTISLKGQKWKNIKEGDLGLSTDLKSIIKFPIDYIAMHPFAKPVELMRHLVRVCTNKGDTVLDFSAGSGSTGVACKIEDRKFIGIELEKKYYDNMVERVHNTNYTKEQFNRLDFLEQQADKKENIEQLSLFNMEDNND